MCPDVTTVKITPTTYSPVDPFYPNDALQLALDTIVTIDPAPTASCPLQYSVVATAASVLTTADVEIDANDDLILDTTTYPDGQLTSKMAG